MFLRDLLRMRLRTDWSNIEEIEIDGGNAVLSGQHGGDHVVTDEPEFDEIEAETTTMFALVIECLSSVEG